MKFEETFERYLTERALRKSSKSLEEVRDKLFAIQKLQNLFPKFKDFIIEEGLADTEEEEPIFFDFVMRREEIKFGIFIEVTESCPNMEKARLNGLNKKLNKDSALDAVIIVWNDEKLSTCALDSLALKKYFGRTEQLINLEAEKIGDFVEITMDFYNQQFVNWAVPEESSFPESYDLVRPRVMEWLKEKILTELQQKIKSKRFKKEEKEAAKKEITEADANRIAMLLEGILSKEQISEEDLESLENFYQQILEEE